MRIAVAFARWNFFIGLKIKNNIKFQCANARIRSGVRLERRVAALLVSQRHPQRLADGLYPTTCVAILLRKHQRCLTYTVTGKWDTAEHWHKRSRDSRN